MTIRFAKLVIACALLSVVLLPGVARAQSAIAGVIKDTSGAVLPGVTVEAASNALIEKTRSVISDSQGAYRIVDLRPGVYSITFTLPGFQTLKRDALELAANFTATINADMKVGALEESVTVSGQSPVVDVNTNVKSQVLPRDVLDAVPTARTIQSIGQLVVGVQLSSPDVGGSRAMQQTYFAVHGSGGAQTVVLVDGLMTNGLMGDGAVQAYHNEAMIQEAVYQTAGGTAETMTGGVNMNLVPKEGGNRFTGGAKFTKSPESWQGNNLTDHLKSLGVTGVDSISNFYEYNAEQGGPLLKDRLWFFAAFRHATYDKPIANTFYGDASLPYPVAYAQCRANPDSCERGVSDEKMDNPIGRLTWQISPRNKFSAYMDRAMRLRGHAMGASTDPRTASVVWHTPTFATGSMKWSSPITARLLLEVGTAFNRERYDNVYQDGIAQERGTAAWYAGARHNDTAQGTLWNASSAQLGNYPDRYSTTAAASYVTGSHAVKFGMQFSKGTYKRWQNANGDLYQTYNTPTAQMAANPRGIPATVTLQNTPITSGERLNGALGLYAQDSYRLGRLTLNYGVRWDYLKQSVMGQPAQQGRFVNTPAYDDIPMPVWKNWSPRMSAVYDFFGTGKTALRFGFNKFVTAGTMGVARNVNPSGLTSSSALRWVDVDGDDIADGEAGCNFGTAGTLGCEINLSQLASGFGSLRAAVVDPDLERPYQYAYNVGLSHEVLSGLAVTAEWIHSDFKNMVTRHYTDRDVNSYTPVTVYSPLDGTAFTVYNVKSQFLGLQNTIDSTDPDLKRHYNSVELNFNARLPHGIRFFGGTSSERTVSNSCSSAVTDPNRLLWCDQSQYDLPLNTQFKLSGVAPLPWYGITFSGSFQSLPGYTLGTDPLQYGVFTWGTGFETPNGQSTFWRVTQTGANSVYGANCPAPCTPGATIIPGLQVAQLDVPITGVGTELTPRLNTVDFAVQKQFKIERFSISPKLDIFNAFNSDDYSAVSSMQYGAAAYQRPSVILQGRIFRIGADVKW